MTSLERKYKLTLTLISTVTLLFVLLMMGRFGGAKIGLSLVILTALLALAPAPFNQIFIVAFAVTIDFGAAIMGVPKNPIVAFGVISVPFFTSALILIVKELSSTGISNTGSAAPR